MSKAFGIARSVLFLCAVLAGACGGLGVGGDDTVAIEPRFVDLAVPAPVCTSEPFTVISPPVARPATDGGVIDCMDYCQLGFLGDDFGIKTGPRPTPTSCTVTDDGDFQIVTCHFPGC